MTRNLLLAAAFATATAAAPAFAGTTVKVSVAGLDAKAVQARIWSAAKAACRAEFEDATQTVSHYDYMECVQTAAATAKTTPVVAREASVRPSAAVLATTGR